MSGPCVWAWCLGLVSGPGVCAWCLGLVSGPCVRALCLGLVSGPGVWAESICFMLFSHHNCEKTLVLSCFRLKMLLFEYVLLCFCSRMCKNHYKTNQKSCFLHIGSPNPLFYRCNFFWQCLFPCLFFQTFYFKAFLKTAFAIRGRLTINLLHALCVFLCIPLFDCKMRTLIGRRPLLGKKQAKPNYLLRSISPP